MNSQENTTNHSSTQNHAAEPLTTNTSELSNTSTTQITEKLAIPSCKQPIDKSDDKDCLTVDECKELIGLKFRYQIAHQQAHDKDPDNELGSFATFTKSTIFECIQNTEEVESFILSKGINPQTDNVVEACEDLLYEVRSSLTEIQSETLRKFESRARGVAKYKKKLQEYISAVTDVAKADILHDQTLGDLIYIPQSNKWLEWNYQEWDCSNQSGLDDAPIHAAFQEICRDFKGNITRLQAQLDRCEDEGSYNQLKAKIKEFQKHSYPWGNMSSRRNIIEAFKQCDNVSISAETFDAKPKFALSQNGDVLDMTQEKLIIHSPFSENHSEPPNYYIRNLRLTQKLGCVYDAEAKCPLWEKTLTRIMPNEHERRYLQQAVGYSLYGEVTEKVVFFLYGHGDNGKSVFTSTISDIFGDLAKNSNKSLFVGKGNFRTADGNVLAGLKGKRFVINDTEIAPDDRLNEDCIKTISGNDGKLTARRVYEKEISFIPQCTLWMFGNHKPKLSAAMDPATLKRIKLIKFGESIPKSEQDKQLTSKLKEEFSGILNWIIEGFNDWRSNGFIEPESISANVKAYADENDTLGEFIRDCVILTDREDDKVSTATLFNYYLSWCDENNIQNKGSKTLFTRRIKQRPEMKQSSSKNWCNMKVPYEPQTEILRGRPYH